MDVLGVDGRHEERGHPATRNLIFHDLIATGLFRALKAIREREGIHQGREHGRVRLHGLHRGLAARGRASGQCAPHVDDPRSHSAASASEALLSGLLQEEHAMIEGN